jgi:hypothetical protein
LGQTAQRSWYEAGEALAEYGRRPIPTSWGHNIGLGEYEQVNDSIERMRQKLEQLAPGVREQIKKEKIAELSPEQAAALDVPVEKLTEANYQQHHEAVQKTHVTHQEVGQRAPEQNRTAAESLADRLRDEELLSSRIAHYRSIVNFEYWTVRCAAEQTKVAVEAREFLYKAKQAYDAAELDDARKFFESSWHAWRKLYDQYPRLLDDLSAEELADGIKQYQRLLQQLDEKLPADFPLGDILKMRQDRDETLKQMYKQLGTPLPGAADKPAAGKDQPKEPKPDAAKPPAAETKPEAAKPEAKAAKPEAKEAKPATDAAKPAAEEPQPRVEDPKPAA